MHGRKSFMLLALDGEKQLVASADVEQLYAHTLIYTNHKFPVNSYFLTQQGREIAQQLTGGSVKALGAEDESLA